MWTVELTHVHTRARKAPRRVECLLVVARIARKLKVKGRLQEALILRCEA